MSLRVFGGRVVPSLTLCLLLTAPAPPASLPRVPVQGLAPVPLALDLAASASELPQLRSLLVSWRGELIAEHYASGVRPGALANIKSASKSIIAALVGIAIERGLIKSVQRADRHVLPGAAPRSRSPQAGDHRRGSADDAVGAGVDERPQLRRMGAEPQLGARRAGAADGERARHRDGVQHRQLASAVGDSHEGDRHQHVAVRAGRAGQAARHHAWPAGRRIRRASISAATRCS